MPTVGMKRLKLCKDNTFYAGEVMAFGDMEETVEYSRDLVRRFFK